MKLIVIRHGKTIENDSGIIQGRNPGTLSEEGHKQARLLGQRLSQENIDYIYSSPSGRCKETLTDILSQLEKHPKVTFEESLQERDFGQLTGSVLDSSYFKLLENDSEESRGLGIESVEDLYTRTKEFTDSLHKKHPGQTIALITHSNNIRVALMFFLHKTFREILDIAKIRNCAYTICNIDAKGTSTLIALDNINHLGWD